MQVACSPQFGCDFPSLRRGGQGGWSRRNTGLVRGSSTAGPSRGTRRRAGSAASVEGVGYALFTPPNPPFARGENRAHRNRDELRACPQPSFHHPRARLSSERIRIREGWLRLADFRVLVASPHNRHSVELGSFRGIRVALRARTPSTGRNWIRFTEFMCVSPARMFWTG